MNIKALTSPWYIMMIGFPGCGKSTFINKIEHPSSFQLLSTDNYIEQQAKFLGKTYSEVFKDEAPAAQKDFDQALIVAILQQENIVHDQTNLKLSKRQRMLKTIPDNYYKLGICVYCSDKEEWTRRLNSRPGKVIPQYIIENMKKSFNPPLMIDGFNDLVWHDTSIN